MPGEGSPAQVLAAVAKANEDALADALDEIANAERREGVPVEMWRALR